MAESEIQTTLATLLGSGVVVDNVERVEAGHVLSCVETDRFGCPRRYVLLHALGGAEPAVIQNALQRGEHEGASVILIGNFASDAAEAVIMSVSQFHARFGGPIPSLLPLERDYEARLVELGRNRLPAGLTGVASDLFEVYVAAGLQFIIGRRVIRYGRNRSGEAVPDGIALSGLKYALFDTKAAESGFSFDANAIRQFASYARDFALRYENIGRPTAFLCVSTAFNDDESALRSRSQSLYADCGTALATLTSAELAKAVELFKHELDLRQFTSWPELLAAPVLTAAEIGKAARAVRRDAIISGQV